MFSSSKNLFLTILTSLLILFITSNSSAQEFNCLDCHDNVIENQFI